MTVHINTPRERLRASRLALRSQMASGQASQGRSSTAGSALFRGDGTQGDAAGNPMLSLLSQGYQAWWKHQPSKIAFDLGRSYLHEFAVAKPVLLVAIAAGVGAAVVTFKPWRLISFTGLALAALKSTRLRDSMLSYLANQKQA